MSGFRESFRMWYSPSCATQTAMKSSGRKTLTSTSAWNLVRASPYLSEPPNVSLWRRPEPDRSAHSLSLLPLRCFWRLHLPQHCSSDTSLHRLQQKEGGGCLEAPSGMMRPMMWLCLARFCVSYCQPSCIQSEPCSSFTELLNASDARWKVLLSKSGLLL